MLRNIHTKALKFGDLAASLGSYQLVICNNSIILDEFRNYHKDAMERFH